MKNSMEVPQMLKIELPYDPAIPLLGTSPKKMKTLTQRDICTPNLLQDYSQKPRYGIKLGVHHQMNEKKM